MRTTLPLRVKKLIGMILLILLVVVYALCAVAVASASLNDKPWYVHMAFFGFSGIIWILPAMWIISWMSRETT